MDDIFASFLMPSAEVSDRTQVDTNAIRICWVHVGILISVLESSPLQGIRFRVFSRTARLPAQGQLLGSWPYVPCFIRDVSQSEQWIDPLCLLCVTFSKSSHKPSVFSRQGKSKLHLSFQRCFLGFLTSPTSSHYMAPIDFPFAHDDDVQKVVEQLKVLSRDSLAAAQGIHEIKRSATSLADKYKNNITALAGLPPGVEDFAKVGLPFHDECLSPLF